MTRSLAELVQRVSPLTTDGEARLLLAAAEGSHAMTGTLEGPYCANARTLPTAFTLQPQDATASGQAVGEFTIVDPCYWTPALPYLYRLELEFRDASGASASFDEMIGLRRFHADGANFMLDRKRIVLRGMTAWGGAEFHPGITNAILGFAREAETSLIVRQPESQFCREASRLGVAIVADLRGLEGGLGIALHETAWQPSVLVVILEDYLKELRLPKGGPLLGKEISPTDDPSTLAEASWADVLAVELEVGERPPAWIAKCCKPAIAIRKLPANDKFPSASERDLCDQLQAELAPDFNLAGYFVEPRLKLNLDEFGFRQLASQETWPLPARHPS